jgi:hypothetical protein
MLMDRVIGAFTFRREVYSEVEKDTSFTQTAWLIVAVVALLSSLGGGAGLLRESFFSWLLGGIVGAVFAVVGFGLAAFVMAWLGRTMFNAEVTFDEIVRTLGLAYVWTAVGVLGIFGALSPALVCLIGPLQFVGFILGLVASLFALKEALDLEWMQVIITVVIGWIVIVVINVIAGSILAVLGLAAAGLAGAFG